jgi:predicted ester cyclase
LSFSQHPLAEGLVRIGETAIAREDGAALRAYFAPGYVLHRPGGDIGFDALSSYFAALRDAFADLEIRRAILIGEGSYLAARTIFSGTFTRPFRQSPAGELQPTGRAVEWEVMNLFRYDAEGRLAEEWVQSDAGVFLGKLTAR